MMRLVVFLLLFLASVPLVSAQTEDFTVRFRIINDLIPPTTPDPLTITAVTAYQIDLSWGSSTDDQLLDGYQIFRDGIAIASTTLTTYSDASLTPETAYTYYVRSYDSVPNYSTSSLSVGTTTLAAPVPPPPSGGGSGGPKVELVSIEVEPSFTSALLTWETSRYARYELRWGTTESYELGLVANQVYQKDNQTLITDLEPNTTYAFELIAYDRDGSRTILSRDTFKTLAQPDVTAPPNISRFRAEADDDDVVLTWQNPTDDFAYVRIVRNPLFYPTDPNNGYIAYQGTAERFIDRDAFLRQNKLYYTAFVYDQSGNRSSGAIVDITKVGRGGSQAPVVQDPIAPTASTSEPEGGGLWTISLEDIIIIQSGEVVRSVDGTYLVDTTKPFTISAPYDLFPRHLKAIQITLSHPVDSNLSYSYLLRANGDMSAYEAVIDNLGFSGTIPLRLAVYDYQTEDTAVARGSIITKNLEPVVEMVRNVVPWYTELWWIIPLLLLIILLFILISRRRKEDEDNPPVRFA